MSARLGRVISYEKLEDLGRVRLSKSFFMRDFLYSEIANWHRVPNFPDDPDVAIETGTFLCEELLEPLQDAFGRIAIRSGYRSPVVNALGNEKGHNCASNEANYARHIWDFRGADGQLGATACIVVPWFIERFDPRDSWQAMAWWVHDNLPYSTVEFFSKLGAFNIGWCEVAERRIDSYVGGGRNCLTKPGMPNHAGRHDAMYPGFPTLQAVSGR